MKLLCNLSDDHHPAPTFTPPELPKRVHVRGVTAGKTKSILNKSIHITANFKITKPQPTHNSLLLLWRLFRSFLFSLFHTSVFVCYRFSFVAFSFTKRNYCITLWIHISHLFCVPSFLHNGFYLYNECVSRFDRFGWRSESNRTFDVKENQSHMGVSLFQLVLFLTLVFFYHFCSNTKSMSFILHRTSKCFRHTHTHTNAHPYIVNQHTQTFMTKTSKARSSASLPSKWEKKTVSKYEWWH